MRTALLVAAVSALALVSCAERTLTTPADRLVGHWATAMEDHLYFSKADSEGMGRYTLVQFDGNTARHNYKIVSQIPDGDRVIVLLLFSDGDQRTDEFHVSQDGSTAQSTTVIFGAEITSELRYVDEKEEP